MNRPRLRYVLPDQDPSRIVSDCRRDLERSGDEDRYKARATRGARRADPSRQRRSL